MLRWGIGVFILIWLCVSAIGGAYATSSINPNVPAMDAPLASAPIRANFGAAYNDVNALQAAVASLGNLNIGSSQPFACTSGVTGAWWLNNGASVYQYLNCDGAAWILIFSVDTINGLLVPQIGGGVQGAISASSTTDLGSIPQANLTIFGSSTISSFGTSAPTGAVKIVTFNGSPTLTYSAPGLVLPGAANLAVVSGSTAIALATSSGNWTVVAFQPPYIPSSNSIRVIGAGSADTPLPGDFVIKWASAVTSGKTETLGTCSSAKAAVQYLIVDGQGNAGTYNITLTGNSINGSGTYVLNENYQSAWVKCDGVSTWTILNLAEPTAAAIIAALGYTPLNPGNNLSELTNTTTARTNLGLGSMAVQNSNSVNITGGSISGVSLALSAIDLAGSSSGMTILKATAAASGTITFPAATDTVALLAAPQTLTNKTIAFGSNTLTGVAPTAAPTFSGRVVMPDGSTWDSTGINGAVIGLSDPVTAEFSSIGVNETAPAGGNINISGQYQVLGAQIAASNLSNGTTGTGDIVLAGNPNLNNPTISGLSTGLGGGLFLCYNNGTGAVTSDGTPCNSSDARLKINWKYNVPGLDMIMALHPGTFDWRDRDEASTQGRQVGITAQAVRGWLPEMVSVGGSRTIVLADGTKQTIDDVEAADYSKLTLPLIVAVQEMQGEIEALKREHR